MDNKNEYFKKRFEEIGKSSEELFNQLAEDLEKRKDKLQLQKINLQRIYFKDIYTELLHIISYLDTIQSRSVSHNEMKKLLEELKKELQEKK